MSSATPKGDKKASIKKAASKQSAQRLAQLKEMLEAAKQDLLQRATEHSQVFEIDAHGDLVDQSTDLSERELRMSMAEKDRRAFSDIEEALQRFEEGTYGICEATGKEIPLERLRAIPTARYCVEAQEEMERRANYGGEDDEEE